MHTVAVGPVRRAEGHPPDVRGGLFSRRHHDEKPILAGSATSVNDPVERKSRNTVLKECTVNVAVTGDRKSPERRSSGASALFR